MIDNTSYRILGMYCCQSMRHILPLMITIEQAIDAAIADGLSWAPVIQLHILAGCDDTTIAHALGCSVGQICADLAAGYAYIGQYIADDNVKGASSVSIVSS